MLKFNDFVTPEGTVDVEKVGKLDEMQRALLVQMSVVWSHISTFEGIRDRISWYHKELQRNGSWADSKLLKEMYSDLNMLNLRIEEFRTEFKRMEDALQN